MDRLQSMKVFANVVVQGSFSSAARLLHLTPQMVSHHIRSLESYLGVALLIRTTRRLRLTEAGQRYYEDCQHLLRQIEESELSVRAYGETPQGCLRICAPVTFGSMKVAPLLVKFSQLHPAIEVELTLADHLQDLTAEGIDIAFRIGRLTDSNLIARPLQPYQLAIAASPGYLKTHGAPTTVEQLQHHQCLANRFDRSGQVWHIEEQGQSKSIQISGSLRINQGNALFHCALNDGGIILQPRVLLEEALAQGGLIELLPDCRLQSQPMHLLYHQQRNKAPNVGAFIHFALQHWGPEQLLLRA